MRFPRVRTAPLHPRSCKNGHTSNAAGGGAGTGLASRVQSKMKHVSIKSAGSSLKSPDWPRPLHPESRRWILNRSHLIGFLIGLGALLLTYAAHVNGRPITSALVAVFGVMAVGAMLGARAGVFAGLAASLTF